MASAAKATIGGRTTGGLAETVAWPELETGTAVSPIAGKGNGESKEQQRGVSRPCGQPRSHPFTIQSPRFPAENRPDEAGGGEGQNQKPNRLVILKKIELKHRIDVAAHKISQRKLREE